jgi:tRNA modification GTPase
VRKTMEAIAEADVVLVVLDISQDRTTPEDSQLVGRMKDRKHIVVLNKTDIRRNNEIIGLTWEPGTHEPRVAFTSALTGDGIDQLRSGVLDIIGDGAGQHEAGFLTNARHQGLVRESLKSLAAAAEAVRMRMPHEMILLDLYGSLRQLDEITGATTADDILNRIFSSFCIGK